MNTTYIDWRKVIKKDRDRWVKAFTTIENDMNGQISWLVQKFTFLLWHIGIPEALLREISEVAEYLGFDESVVMAAQVFYDEAWYSCRERPMCGCTSLSSDEGFGRNLDYGYPDNAAEMVYRTSIMVGGKKLEIEGFAGLLGWVAVKHDALSVSLNQAPCLRKLRRSRMPTLLWFRAMCDWMCGYSVPSDSGETELTFPPAADCLLHAEVKGKRFIAEVFDSRIRWMRVTAKTAQANTYQLFSKYASKDWEADSAERMRAAISGRTVRSGLKKASVDGWTIDTFMMRG